MILTYENYLQENHSLTFEEMKIIHEGMTACIESDADALELYNDIIKISVRYAAVRSKWPMLSRQEKIDQDSGRTSCHDAVIVRTDKLARYQKTSGIETSWRESLGDDRRRIGDFSCYLAFVNGLNAR